MQVAGWQNYCAYAALYIEETIADEQGKKYGKVFSDCGIARESKDD
jgi:hypothetical protein